MARLGLRRNEKESLNDMAPRVLIADKLSPTAVQIFRDRGIETEVKYGTA